MNGLSRTRDNITVASPQGRDNALIFDNLSINTIMYVLNHLHLFRRQPLATLVSQKASIGSAWRNGSASERVSRAGDGTD